MNAADEAITLLKKYGGAAYFGEPVSQLEHALQTAHFAVQAGSSRELVLAALLHDVGHLLVDPAESAADEGIDARHEIAGYDWLLSRFGELVAEPVRLHVPAKRYLCRTNPAYLSRLSPASVRSLELQGGPFTEEEAREFESHSFFREALRLRSWDDEAKIPGMVVAPLEAYEWLWRA
ncbi:MAG TPA: HD domain-containing protein [Bryobacteraceae bacterium]|nr:HD domain-containing protein [Bryobacteraceae bacterium]